LASERDDARTRVVVLASVLAIATVGLVYELAIAATASYLLGDSVRQFSLVIGTYLSALGLGAYLSRHVERRLSARGRSSARHGRIRAVPG
jgi:spermidine synthase